MSRRTTSTILFFSMNLTGLWISVSSTNWFLIWSGLELNLYSFIPILLLEKKPKCSEAAIKYFIPQAMGSSMLLIASMIKITSLKTPLMLIALLLKAGLPPLHQWYPNVMSLSSWPICWWLTVPQKLPPLLLIISFPMGSMTTLNWMAIALIWSGMMMNNQTNLRSLFAYSSIGQTTWMISLSQFNTEMSLLMLTNYIIAISMIMMIISTTTWSTGQPQTPNEMNKFTLMIQLLHLGGYPPLMGFALKLWTMTQLIQINATLSLILFVIGALFNLTFYLKTIIFLLWTTPLKPTSSPYTSNMNLWMFTSWLMLPLLMLPMILNLL